MMDYMHNNNTTGERKEALTKWSKHSDSEVCEAANEDSSSSSSTSKSDYLMNEQPNIFKGFYDEVIQRKNDDDKPNNTGLPDALKAGIEAQSGFSMDDVRVHYNSSLPNGVDALAYTKGQIFMSHRVRNNIYRTRRGTWFSKCRGASSLTLN